MKKIVCKTKVVVGKIKTDLVYMYWKKFYSLKLEKFKDIHNGEDCFIIGNGPSLNKMNLELLNNYYTFGLNKIYLIFKRMNLHLSYHVAVNPHVIKQSADEILKLNCPSFISFLTAKKIKLKSENIYFLWDTQPYQLFFKDLKEGIHQGNTVTYAAMQLAYYMGFKRVFLIGVDHNFLQKGNPHDEQIMKEDDSNHFDPNYFKGQSWQLADMEGSEKFYRQAKEEFENNCRKIFDATIDGKLEVFEKIDFDQALKIAKKKKLIKIPILVND